MKNDRDKYGNVPLIDDENDVYFLNRLFSKLLKRKLFYDLCIDVIKVGIYKSQGTTGELIIGEKYTRKEMCKLFNWEKDEEIPYKDFFMNEKIFNWMTRKDTDLNSKQVKDIINSASTGMKLYLFINKSKDEGSEHYFMGEVKYIEGTAQNDVESESNKKVVRMQLKLETAVKQDLYDYITKK